VCQAHRLGKTTIYRWLKRYEEEGSVSSLVDLPRSGGRGKSRLDETRTALIQEVISSHYLTRQKKRPSEIVLEVQRLCHQAGLPAPAASTVRRRIPGANEETTRRRLGNKAARERFKPQTGEFPDADYPLQVVELDHTVVDIILVDEVYRQPIGRPYLTMAIDVYSRMVMGFYLSYDPPGTVGTGLCMAHMLLPKEEWLAKVEVEGGWPCWGRPGALHLDNAKEFRGGMMQRACEKYDIRLEFRPVKTPEYGGHIERLMGTCMRKVHTLPGTTFSNSQQRGEYNSQKMAALTLKEFEQWLTTYIIEVYHKSVHTQTNQIPFERFRDGILGTPDQPGIGLPERLYDEQQVRLDFMPAIQRSVQQYGVLVDHVHYYADVLRPYINRLEPGNGKHRGKQQLTFKRDPRDISVLYLLEPNTQFYHRVPYRNTSRPSISVWEYRASVRQLKKQGAEKLDENAIFAAYDRMRALELAAVEKTQRMTPSTRRMLRGVSLEELVKQAQSGLSPEVLPIAATPQTQEVPIDISALQPFDDLEVDGLWT
jgi:putative transposase